jgi:hypothetical protein|tara:strand:- start:589 stop:831 length:243 start_codon:yes stop_codon:yes gene_type:complete
MNTTYTVSSESLHHVVSIKYKKNDRLGPQSHRTVDLEITFDPAPWDLEPHRFVTKELVLFLSEEFEAIVLEGHEANFVLA